MLRVNIASRLMPLTRRDDASIELRATRHAEAPVTLIAFLNARLFRRII